MLKLSWENKLKLACICKKSTANNFKNKGYFYRKIKLIISSQEPIYLVTVQTDMLKKKKKTTKTKQSQEKKTKKTPHPPILRNINIYQKYLFM